MIRSIPDVNDIIPPMMSLAMSHNANSPNIVSCGDHGNVADIKLDEAGDFGGLEVQSDGVADFDGGVGVADCAGVVGDEVGHAGLAELHAFHFAELVFCLFGGDAVDCEAALDIVDKAEILAGLVNGDDICSCELALL
jgi:hypothetical protein